MLIVQVDRPPARSGRYADGLVEFYCLERIAVLQFSEVTLDSETARVIPLKEVSQALPPQQYFFAATADG
jgi:hypothetical protein